MVAYSDAYMRMLRINRFHVGDLVTFLQGLERFPDYLLKPGAVGVITNVPRTDSHPTGRVWVSTEYGETHIEDAELCTLAITRPKGYLSTARLLGELHQVLGW